MVKVALKFLGIGFGLYLAVYFGLTLVLVILRGMTGVGLLVTCILSSVLGAFAGFVSGFWTMGRNDIDKDKYEGKNDYFTSHQTKPGKVILSISTLLMISVIFIAIFIYACVNFSSYNYEYERFDSDAFFILSGLSLSSLYWLFYVIGGARDCYSSRCKTCNSVFSSIKTERSDESKTEDWQRKKETHSGTTHVGSVYVNNQKVGDVYGDSWSSTSYYKRKITTTKYVQHYRCAFCGNTFTRNKTERDTGKWEIDQDRKQ